MTTHENPVPVHLVSAEEGVLGSRAVLTARFTARYETIVLSDKDPVQCILPEDPARVAAYVLPLDNPVVVGTKGQAAAQQNTATSVPRPIGAYIPATLAVPFPVNDCDAVFAGVTVAGNSRVTVAAYYRRSA